MRGKFPENIAMRFRAMQHGALAWQVDFAQCIWHKWGCHKVLL
jgi:hypothetical protein